MYLTDTYVKLSAMNIHCLRRIYGCDYVATVADISNIKLHIYLQKHYLYYQWLLGKCYRELIYK